jgi:hypothetical protein
MFTTNGQNQLLDATDITHLSSHTDYPGESGANEQSGGDPASARVAVTFGAAAGRTLTVAGTPSVDVPDYEDHAWWAFWDAASAGNCRAILPNDGTAFEYCLDLATDIFATKAAHGWSEDQPIVFYMNAPAPLVAGVIYYAVNVTATTFQVSDAPADYALDITAQATEPAVVSKITVDPAAGGQRVVSLGPSATLHNAF